MDKLIAVTVTAAFGLVSGLLSRKPKITDNPLSSRISRVLHVAPSKSKSAQIEEMVRAGWNSSALNGEELVRQLDNVSRSWDELPATLNIGGSVYTKEAIFLNLLQNFLRESPAAWREITDKLPKPIRSELLSQMAEALFNLSYRDVVLSTSDGYSGEYYCLHLGDFLNAFPNSLNWNKANSVPLSKLPEDLRASIYAQINNKEELKAHVARNLGSNLSSDNQTPLTDYHRKIVSLMDKPLKSDSVQEYANLSNLDFRHSFESRNSLEAEEAVIWLKEFSRRNFAFDSLVDIFARRVDEPIQFFQKLSQTDAQTYADHVRVLIPEAYEKILEHRQMHQQ